MYDYVYDDLRRELSEKGLTTSSEWKVYVYILLKLRYWPEPQPQHLDEAEANLMNILRQQGFSIREIAFSCDRSKSTVFEILRKFEEEKPES